MCDHFKIYASFTTLLLCKLKNNKFATVIDVLILFDLAVKVRNMSFYIVVI
jgi:hypothetical protein